ncbi:hypothetical protein LTR37_004213 [Vermiconidia calcicola]|uniref:Uncharacterized protein n=1 Tax=Vermiconidia calcicola TaxID=1690605 RepID=A0ACC3NPF5_9PEZI|nr:hypothetical protein LTR37_004213 [Vermiconidia calcicola]
MRHVDGIGVNIALLNAQPRAEYHNPYEKRHGEFEGGFASRTIASRVGSAFLVQLEFAPEFDLLRSEGIIIIVPVGDSTEVLTYAENAQCFWIPAQKLRRQRKYSIDRYKVWQNGVSPHPTQEVPLRFPRPAGDGQSASADWMMKDEDFTANQGCISVYVARSSFNSQRGSVDGITDPPEAWRYLPDRGTPEVIHGHWVNPADASDYIFEFRNLGTDDDSNAPAWEADPAFGHDDEEIRTRIWLDSLDNSDAHSKWGDWEYVDGKGDAASNGSGLTHNRGYTKRRTANNHNKHHERNGPSRSNHKLHCSRAAAQKPSFGGCDNEDDEEELPTAGKLEVKEEPEEEMERRSTQPPDPPQDEAVNQGGVANADVHIEPPAAEIVDLIMETQLSQRSR